MSRLVSVDDYERKARRRLPRMMFDYIQGGAEDEVTLRANREAFQRVNLRHHVLRDVTERAQRLELLGEELQLPVLLAPVGLASVACQRAEVLAASAATQAGTVSLVSTAASDSLESIAEATPRPQWFQLYPWGDWSAVQELIDRARQGGYSTMVVTVDVPVTGGRERDLRNGMVIPPRPTWTNLIDLAAHPRWLARLAFGAPITFANVPGGDGSSRRSVTSLAQRHADLLNPGHTWEHLSRMRDMWEGRLLVKGVTEPEDARRAIGAGADGIIVSNHGGRQLDGLAASLMRLTDVVAAVSPDVPVLLDGGVRRGTDVVKALCLGAKAVLIGRPWLYGAAVQGESGIVSVLETLRAEIDRAMALMGCASLEDLGPDLIRWAPPSPEYETTTRRGLLRGAGV